MDEQRLSDILERFSTARILVAGDFFLDQYLVLDAELTEKSLETGLEAYQVVAKRLYPGAAGTVTSNLKALDAGVVLALGVIGVDGEGFELKRGLNATGVDTELLIECCERFTPTYTKPMLRSQGSEEELNRIDIKNRSPLPLEVEQRVIAALRDRVRMVDAVIVADQVQERNCGVITDGVRTELASLAAEYPATIFIADSRARIGEFRNLWIKPNKFEAYRAVHGREAAEVGLAEAITAGTELKQRSHKPVFITMGEKGILVVTDDHIYHVPTLHHTEPIDIVGAGDSVMAGIALALCSGASPVEAAIIGNVVASITVQQIGVTGTATRSQVLQRFRECGDYFLPTLLTDTSCSTSE